MNNLKDKRQQMGITLIALVITVIVLLILAGVALATISGNNNIIENANNAVGQYNEKALADQGLLNSIEKKLIEYSNGGGTSTDTPTEPETPTPPTTDPETPTPPSVDANGLATAPYTIQPDATNNPNLQIVIPAGFAPAVLSGGNAPGQNGSVASILAADQWSSITATQINQGIVVVDHAITYDNGQTTGTVPDFNEYVWVPITGSGRNTFAPYAWTIGTNTTKQDLTSDGYWDDTTTTEYTNMVNSVNNNKGFYISRYEASNNGSSVAQSKRGQAPWVRVAQTTAITASANNPTANTHLMYGAEWDSTLNWLIGNATISSSTSGQTKPMELADIQTSSRSWGNYSNSTGDAATGKGNPQNTGYSEYWKANNIYDLAGNVDEWTQEKYSTVRDRANRGGHYVYRGDYFPAATRYDCSESTTYPYLRFPFQLLLVALYSGSDAPGN